MARRPRYHQMCNGHASTRCDDRTGSWLRSALAGPRDPATLNGSRGDAPGRLSFFVVLWNVGSMRYRELSRSTNVSRYLVNTIYTSSPYFLSSPPTPSRGRPCQKERSIELTQYSSRMSPYAVPSGLSPQRPFWICCELFINVNTSFLPPQIPVYAFGSVSVMLNSK